MHLEAESRATSSTTALWRLSDELGPDCGSKTTQLVKASMGMVALVLALGRMIGR